MSSTRSIARWTHFHALLLLLSLGGLVLLRAIWPLLLGAGLSFALLIYQQRRALAALKPFGGYANWLTVFRLGLLLLAGFQYDRWHPYVLFGFFVLVLILDAFDGPLARRYGHASEAGAALDIETDALLCALLAGIHYLSGAAGWWILLAGGLRYGYVWAIHWAGLENVRVPPHRWSRTIGILFTSSLLGPLVAPLWLAYPVLVAGAGLVSYSFGLSFYQSWKGRATLKMR